MPLLAARFSALRARKERALIPFVMAGDPSPAATPAILEALAAGGADVIELGLAFSDPIADGPTIQAAAQRALDAGATLDTLFAAARAFRAAHDTPLVIMTYTNPVFRRGYARFAAEAAAAGIAGVIISDLPPEEADEWCAAAAQHGLDTIFLLAPTSTAPRIARAAARSTGFVYCVSRTGVTGARAALPADLTDLVARLRAETDKPIAVGFGISTPEQVRDICAIADGAVVGSALVDLIARHAGDPKLPSAVRDFIRSLKAATQRA